MVSNQHTENLFESLTVKLRKPQKLEHQDVREVVYFLRERKEPELRWGKVLAAIVCLLGGVVRTIFN